MSSGIKKITEHTDNLASSVICTFVRHHSPLSGFSYSLIASVPDSGVPVYVIDKKE